MDTLFTWNAFHYHEKYFELYHILLQFVINWSLIFELLCNFLKLNMKFFFVFLILENMSPNQHSEKLQSYWPMLSEFNMINEKFKFYLLIFIIQHSRKCDFYCINYNLWYAVDHLPLLAFVTLKICTIVIIVLHCYCTLL